VQFRPVHTETRLQGIFLDGGYPVPRFNPDVKRYELPYGPNFPKTVEAVPLDSFATWQWTSEVYGHTMDIRIRCVAEDTNFWTLYTVRIQLPDGVGQYAETPLAVYPNPAHTVLHVCGMKGECVQVFDLSGRLLLQAESNGDETLPLNVSGLSNGMYLLRCGRRVARFMVVR
jgi:hypothetical protein